jgi:hypothetical protein
MNRQKGKAIVLLLLKAKIGVDVVISNFLLMLYLSFYMIQNFAATNIALTFLILPIVIFFVFVTLVSLRYLMDKS